VEALRCHAGRGLNGGLRKEVALSWLGAVSSVLNCLQQNFLSDWSTEACVDPCIHTYIHTSFINTYVTMDITSLVSLYLRDT
jgi:hypothetical protein